MLFPFTFDLDGVLADTREANRQAYLDAGVIQSDAVWGRPAEAWLSDPMAHMRKQREYPKRLRQLGKQLSGASALEELRMSGFKVAVVTNASWPSATAVLQWLNLRVDALLCGRKEETLDVLQPLAHIDDQPVAYENTILYTPEMTVAVLQSHLLTATYEGLMWTP